MATYSISATPSGSSKNNDVQRDIAAVFPFDAAKYRTISEITRVYGIWCNTGGKYQSVVLSGYDQLIDSATGKVIKTSSTGESTCHGTGPAAENYMTCVLRDWTQAESNAAVAAWKAGTLLIRRSVSVKSYTSSNHGKPYERDGFYDDTITITGSTVPFTSYRPQITAFTCMRSEDGATETQLSTRVYAHIQLDLNDAAGLGDNPRLILEYATRADFTGTVERVLLAAEADTIAPYLAGSDVLLGDNFSVGSNYYFRLFFSLGEEEAQAGGVTVGMSYTPIHIPQSNAGVALGMYSNATGDDRRFECNYPAYLYGGVAQIGNGDVSVLHALGIQTGQEAIQSIASGQIQVFERTFATPYASPPVMVVSLRSDVGGYLLARCSAAVQYTRADGFTALVANYSGSALDLGLSWAAFGQIANAVGAADMEG